MGYIYLTLSSLCSLSIAHLLKMTAVRGARTLNTLTINYLVAFIIAFTIGFGEDNRLVWSQSRYLFLFCLIIGVFFIGNFVVYGKSVHANGVGVSVAAMRLSLLIPVVISIFLYSENLDSVKLLGILGVLGALLLLIPQKSEIRIGKIHASWLLLITFMLSGLADASLKIYQEDFSMQLNESLFMGIIFMASFVMGLTACFYRGGPLITKKELILGTCIGIPNLYSSIFLIYALEGIRGAVAFPIVNTLNVLGGTFLGLLFWKDRVSFRQWLGIATAVIAILLLVL
ncbi:MAG: EamA family transporter [Balneolaceae bacterium]